VDFVGGKIEMVIFFFEIDKEWSPYISSIYHELSSISDEIQTNHLHLIKYMNIITILA